MQTILVNPVIVELGALQVYLNTLTWPVVAAGALVRWTRGRDRRLNPVLTTVAVATVTLAWLGLLQVGLQGARHYALGSFLRLLYVPLSVVAALAVYREIDRLLDIALVALGIKGALLLVGLAQGPIDILHRLTVPEVGGHNIFAAFATFLVVLRASTWILRGRRPSLPVLGSLAVATVCVFVTFSRGAFLALLGGAAVLTALAAWHHRARRRWIRIGLMLALVSVPLMTFAPIRERFTSFSVAESSGRTEIWAPAWEGFVAHPIAGKGFGSFEASAESFGDIAPTSEAVTYSAHDLPLQILYETGLLGFIAIALATWLVVRRCRSVVIAPVGAAILIVSMFETFPYVVQVSWVLGMVCAVGFRWRYHQPDEHDAVVEGPHPTVARRAPRPALAGAPR